MDELTAKQNFILYTSPEGEVKLNVFLEGETIWLTQKMMAELFGVDVRTVNEHLQNIYKTFELTEEQTIRKFRIVQSEGGRSVEREVGFYNLDAIISVGYRVNSSRATQFRIWATQVLREYIVKGFAMNDERLKQGEQFFGQDYLKELLERIRSIRTSERRIYLQITDIFSECSIDYDPKSEVTKEFFATVQNKFHYAITGQTAAEIIHSHAEIVNKFLSFNEYKILDGKGVISIKQAEQKALAEYNEFNKKQMIESDFQKEVKRISSRQKKG